MKNIINLIGKWTGAAKAWQMLDGYKTKIGAVSLILSGLADVTLKLSQLTDFASLLKFVKMLPADQGWLAIAAGIAALGLGHKMEKATTPETK